MKRLFTILFVFMVTFSFSTVGFAKWVVIDSSAGEVYYVDKDNIKRTGGSGALDRRYYKYQVKIKYCNEEARQNAIQELRKLDAGSDYSNLHEVIKKEEGTTKNPN